MKKLFQPAARFPLILGVAAVLALTAGIGVATGTIPTSNGTINACQAKVNGFRYVRLLDNGESCHGAEKALSWNQKGPKGDPGGASNMNVRPTEATIAANDDGSVIAACHPGEKAAGAGYSFPDSNSLEIRTLFPSNAGDKWLLRVVNHSSIPAPVVLAVTCLS
jgi:hypothetical protein